MEQLKKNSNFEAYLNKSKDAVAEYNCDLQCQYINPVAAAWLGLKPEDILGKNHQQLLHDNPGILHLSGFISKLECCLKQVFRTAQESSIIHKILVNNKVKFYETTYTPINNVNNDIEGVFLTGREVTKYKLRKKQSAQQLRQFNKLLDLNITSHKQTEVRLQQALQQSKYSEELLRAIIDTSSDWILIKNRDFRFILANQSFANAHGKTVEEMIGLDDFELGFPDELIFGNPAKGIRGIRNDDKAAFLGKTVHNPYTPVIDAKGKWHILDSQKTPLRDKDGNIFAILVFARDITERVQAEQALIESEARFQQMAANVPGMIYQFLLKSDGSMTFPYVSLACRELYEVEPEVIQADAMVAINMIYPDDRQSFDESVANSAQTLQPWVWSGRLLMPSGKMKWVEATSRPQKQANGDILWNGLLMDISGRKQIEEALLQKSEQLEKTLASLKRTQSQLIHSEKMFSLGQLVAGVAHEINNPISFIYGNLIHASFYEYSE